MSEVDQIILQIAKQHLNVETLDTRNSDSLDFHDCSVWGLKSAMQAAYDLGRLSTLQPQTSTWPGKKGTSYKGTMRVSYSDLVETWGEPSKGDKYKTEAEWLIRISDEMVATIYNYKNSRVYSSEYPEIQNVTEWNIGGHSGEVVDKVIGMMAGRAKLVQRQQPVQAS